MAILKVLATSDARTELPKALRRFREEGAAAEALIFGAHRKPEAAVIPFELYEHLLPMIEDLAGGRLAHDRMHTGMPVLLNDVAAP